MMSSGIQFPKEQFINSLRTSGKADHILKQTSKLNIQWIYEATKFIHNFLIDSKEKPNTKLNSLKFIKSLLQNCDVPCLTLIQVYILPILYSVASYKPQQTGQRRGHRFFTENGYSPRQPDIEETGIKFLSLSTQLLYVASIIKTRRTLQNEQLTQQSQFVQYYNRLKRLGVTGISSISQLRFFTESFAKGARDKYLLKLKNFEQHSEHYSQYFVIKMVQSLQTQQNPLFSNTGKSVSSLSTDLDMRKLLKYGDTYITSPLIQELNDGLQTSENFIVKKNFLSLLSDFVKWADVESFVQVSYEDTIDQIAFRVSEVEGQNGLNEGENIYPEVKGQKQAKKKFYIEFLKCIQVWSKCIDVDIENDDQTSKVKELYEFFKVEKRFKFPQNLMAKRIQADFQECKQYNKQRNEKILEKLKLDETSVINNKKSINSINKAVSISKIKQNKVKQKSSEDLKRQLDRCYQYLNSLFDNEDHVEFKMKELISLKQNLDKDLQNLTDEPQEEQIIEIIDDGDAIIEQIDIITPIYQEYKKGDLNFNEFAEKVNDELQEENIQEQKKSKSRKSIKSEEEQRHQVLNSFNPNFLNRKEIQEKQKVKTSEQIINAMPITINDDKKSYRQAFSSQSESVHNSIQNHFQTGKNFKSPSHLQSNISSEVVQSPYFEKKSSIFKEKQSNIEQKLSRLQNKSIASSLKERMSRKKNERSQKSSQVQESSFHDKIQESEVQVNQGYTYQNNIESNKSESQFDEVKKSKIKQIISSHRSNRSQRSSKSSKFSNSKFSSSKKSSKREFIVNKSSNRDSESKVKENIKQNQLYYTQTFQNKMYNVVPTNKSNNIIKFENYKVSNMSEKKNQNFVQKTSQKSSFHENKYSVLSENEGTKNHYSVSQKLGDKYLAQDEVFVEENIMKRIQKPEKINSVKYSSIKKSNMQSSNLEKPGYSSSGQKEEFSKDQYSQNSMSQNKNISKYSNTSRISKKNSENIEMSNSKVQSSNYSNLVQEYYENDFIREPSLKPLENSYYGVDEIEAKIKNQKKPLFKECFDVEKQVISVGNKKMQWIPAHNEYDLFRKQRRVPDKVKAQGQYLLKRLRRNKGQGSRISSKQGSKLSSRLHHDSFRKDNRSFSRKSNSNASRQYDFLSSNKSEKSSSSLNSLSKPKSSFLSKQSIGSMEGRLLSSHLYERFFVEIDGNQVKKSLLKNKSLLKKNNLMQVGSLCSTEDKLKVKVYITSMEQIEDVKYSFSQHSNFNIKGYPQSFSVIPPNKQKRISMVLDLKNMPFQIPKMTIQYLHQDSRKSHTFYLPCYPHKFIEWEKIQPQAISKQFSQNQRNIIKTNEFKINKKVVKSNKLEDYIGNLSLIKQEGKKKTLGVSGKYKEQNFMIKFILNGSSRMAIQGLTSESSQFLQYIMCSLLYLFNQDQ